MISAICHVHSDWSYDGSWSLGRLVERFKRRGVRVMLMTEHDRGFSPERFAAYRAACAEESTEELLVVPGIEYSDPTNTIHILVWGTPFLGADRPTEDLLKSVTDENGIAVLAHPTRRNAWSLFEKDWTHALTGIEVWNRKTDGWAPSRHAQAMLENTDLTRFVGLDFHTSRQFFPLTLQLQVQGTISEESVNQCLRSQDVRAYALGRPLQSSFAPMPRIALMLAEGCRKRLARYARSFRQPVIKAKHL